MTADPWGDSFRDQVDRLRPWEEPAGDNGGESPNGKPNDQAGHAEVPPLRFVRMVDAKVSGMPKDIVDGLVPAELGLVFAMPSAGKTYFLLALAMAVAKGEPFFGRSVRPGPTVYIAAEKAKSAEARLAYMRDQTGGKTGPLFIVQDRVDIADDKLNERLAAVLALAAAEAGQPVRLIIVDTVRRVLGGLKEDEEGFGLLIDWCARLSRAIGAGVLLVHHCGKDRTRGSRGHSSLLGAVELEIFIEKPDRRGAPRIVHATKVNDGEEGPVMAFDLVPGQAGTDEDGQPITLCTVQSVDLEAALAEPQDGSPDDGVRMSGRQRCAMAIVRKLDRDGTGAPYETVRSHLIQSIAAEPKAPQDAARQAERTLARLIQRGALTHDRGRLSVVEP